MLKLAGFAADSSKARDNQSDDFLARAKYGVMSW